MTDGQGPDSSATFGKTTGEAEALILTNPELSMAARIVNENQTRCILFLVHQARTDTKFRKRLKVIEK